MDSVVLVHPIPLCFIFHVSVILSLNVDLPRIAQIVLEGTDKPNCSVFSEVLFSDLNSSATLKLGPKSLQNIVTIRGNMTELLDDLRMNIQSLQFNQILHSSDQSFTLKKYSSRLIVEDSSCEHVSLPSSVFSPCLRLQLISIGLSCFQSTSSLMLTNMPMLRTVLIKSNCFMPKKGSGDGIFRVWNCPQLISLTIESSCFNDIESIDISRLDQLISFEIGSGCFSNCSSLSISKCEMLECFEFPEDSFPHLKMVKIECE